MDEEDILRTYLLRIYKEYIRNRRLIRDRSESKKNIANISPNFQTSRPIMQSLKLYRGKFYTDMKRIIENFNRDEKICLCASDVVVIRSQYLINYCDENNKLNS